MVKTLYLAHPFKSRREIRKWELKFEAKYNLRLVNPFYDNQRSDMEALDAMVEGSQEQREYFKQRDTDVIVDGDLELIRKSDGIVACTNDSSIGTPMEIFFAARILNIPVYIITKRYTYHPWILKYATKIFPTLSAFEKFVKAKYGIQNA